MPGLKSGSEAPFARKALRKRTGLLAAGNASKGLHRGAERPDHARKLDAERTAVAYGLSVNWIGIGVQTVVGSVLTVPAVSCPTLL